MADKSDTAQQAQPVADAAKAQGKKVLLFYLQARHRRGPRAVEVPYTNGQKVWVNRAYVPK